MLKKNFSGAPVKYIKGDNYFCSGEFMWNQTNCQSMQVDKVKIFFLLEK